MQASEKPRPAHRVPVVLTVLVGVIATAVAWLGTRESTQTPISLAAPPAATASGTIPPVDTIVLPQDDPELPSGPHQATFATSCTICHSTRLPLTQPPFPKKQWTEVVQKMVKNYGAPITPEAQEQIVDYLTTVRGN